MFLSDGERLRRESLRRLDCKLAFPGLLPWFELGTVGRSELGDVSNWERVWFALCWASHRYVSRKICARYYTASNRFRCLVGVVVWAW